MAPPTPPTTPPAAPTAAQNTTEGAQNQIALFNDQMYLLDSFAHEVDNAELFSAKIIDIGVPPQPPFEKINELITLSGNKIYNWIHDITPHEYAQLIPKIQLFWVNVTTNGQVEIPLVAPSDLDGAMASPYYYTTKAIGLKSIDMDIDGNTNPVTGKMYNINIKLIFDSLNTFFDPVSGLAGLRYSDLFRSHGTAGSPGNQGTLKLSMSYDGPPELVTKYALDKPGQAFTTYLNLITSKLSVKENLYAQVDAKFQGFEEAIYKNNSIFDFLRIDLASELATQQDALRAARTSNQRKRAVATERQRAEIDAARASIDAGEGAIRNVVAGFTRSENVEGSEWSRAGAEHRNNQQRTQLLTIAKAAGFPAARVQNVHGIPTVVIHVDGQVLPLNVNAPQHGENNPIRLVAQGLMDKYKEGNVPLEGGLENLMRHATHAPNEHGNSGGRFLRADAQDIEDAKAKFRREVERADATVAAAEAGFQANVQSARVAKITEVLQKTIWDFEKEAFRSVAMTASEFSKYTQQLLTGEVKNYFALNPAQVTVEAPKEPPSPQSAREATRSLHKIGQDIRTLTNDTFTNQGKAREASRGLGVWQQRLGALQAAGVTGEGRLSNHLPDAMRNDFQMARTPQERYDMRQSYLEGRIAKRQGELDDSERAIAQAQTRLTALRTDQSQISSTSKLLQSLPQLEAQLNEKKNIRFILLGDLLALIMSRLRNLAAGVDAGSTPNPVAQKHLDDTVLVLTKIGLTQFPSTVVKKVSLYQLPISILQLQKVLSDLLHGNMKTSLTLFEFLRAIIKMIGLSQKRKAQFLSVSYMSSDFALSFMTYPVHSLGSGTGGLTISTNPASSVKKNGMIIWARNASTSLVGADGTYGSNKSLRIPHFFFGGYTHGAVKSITIEEKSDKLQLVAMSNLTAGSPSYVIPALFETTIKLVGTPFFQIGMHFYVDTPTLNIDSSTQGWFYLRAYYSIKKLSHSYTAGGQFTTTIKGVVQPLPAGGAPMVETLPAGSERMSGGSQQTTFQTVE